MVLPLIMKTEKNLNKKDLVNFVTFTELQDLKIEAKAFEAGDFLKVFVVFEAYFLIKKYIYKRCISTFDPLSWLTPSIMVMDIFLQEPWEKGRE